MKMVLYYTVCVFKSVYVVIHVSVTYGRSGRSRVAKGVLVVVLTSARPHGKRGVSFGSRMDHVLRSCTRKWKDAQKSLP